MLHVMKTQRRYLNQKTSLRYFLTTFGLEDPSRDAWPPARTRAATLPSAIAAIPESGNGKGWLEIGNLYFF